MASAHSLALIRQPFAQSYGKAWTGPGECGVSPEVAEKMPFTAGREKLAGPRRSADDN
jgi:hypothetical protein